MQQFLFENPWVVGAIGAVISAVVAFVWIQTANRIAFYGMLAASALTILLVLLNNQVETETEKIRGLLSKVASAVQRNDHDEVFSYIHPNAPESNRARSVIPQYQFTYARISRVKSIEVNNQTTPETAIAEFNAVADASNGQFTGHVARFVRVYLMKQDNRWLFRDYEHFDAREGFQP